MLNPVKFHSFNVEKYTNLPLPLLQGVLGLSPHEIHTDLCDLQRLLAPKTDGEESVDSDDILDSHYPVKPRKSIRQLIDREEYSQDYDKPEIISAEVDEALRFIRSLAVNQKDLHDQELQREELETISEGYRHSYLAEGKQYREQRLAQENYLKVFQALLLRQLRLRSVYSQQAAVYRTLLAGLVYQRIIGSNMTPLLTKLSVSGGTNVQGVAAGGGKNHRIGRSSSQPTAATATATAPQLLVIQSTAAIASEEASSSDPISSSAPFLLSLQPSQTGGGGGMGTVQTPYGEGQVVNVAAAPSYTVSIRLNYGLLYTAPQTLYGWLAAERSQHSAEKTLATLRTASSTSSSTSSAALFFQQAPVVSSFEQIESSIATMAAAPAVERQSDEDPAAMMDNDEEEPSLARQTGFVLDQSPVSRRDRIGARLASHVEAQQAEHLRSYLPLVLAPNGAAMLAFLAQQKATRPSHQPVYDLQAFQHLPGSVPSLNSAIMAAVEESAAVQSPAIIEQQQQATGSSEGGDGSSSASSLTANCLNKESIVWRSDVHAIRQKVDEMEQALRQLEQQRWSLIQSMTNRRQETSQHLAALSTLRLAMFTKRIAHRNLLQQHNIAFVPAVGGGGGAGGAGEGGGGGVAAAVPGKGRGHHHYPGNSATGSAVSALTALAWAATAGSQPALSSSATAPSMPITGSATGNHGLDAIVAASAVSAVRPSRNKAKQSLSQQQGGDDQAPGEEEVSGNAARKRVRDDGSSAVVNKRRAVES